MKTITKNMMGLLLQTCFLIFTENGHSQAMADSSTRNFQVSFLPYISVNRLPVNDKVSLSINIIGGIVKEVDGAEIGGVLNIDKGNAKSFQLAGVENLVGGSSEGFQAAGVINTTDSQKGLQMAGVINLVKTNANACQLAGVANIVGGPLDGFQSAGVYNSAKTVNGTQIAGVFNGSGETTGSQISGFMNQAGKVKGAQISGCVNHSTEFSGIQVSGFINKTGHFKGTQIGVVNLSDSCQGTPIGVFSYVKNGYHTIEISTDELFYANVAFRTGTKKFHDIFSIGIRPGQSGKPLWAFGYGVGTSFGNRTNLLYDLDFSSQHVSKNHFNKFDSQLCKLYFGIDKKILSKVSIAIGATYNLFITDTKSPQYGESLSSIPYSFWNTTYQNGYNIRSWISGRLAIRVYF
jgi:hypothetical protein